MPDDISDISDFYQRDPQKEHNRLDLHQLEYDMTWRYFDQYLPPRGSILEIGAATGRYTVGLAKRGYAITAVDLSAAQLETARQSLAAEGLEGRVQFVVADVRDLSPIPQKDFDAVLLMGPLYHLVMEADRQVALKGVFERLRPGGILFTALISRFAIMGDLIKNVPDWIEGESEVRSILARGRSPEDYPRGGFRGYFTTIPEIAPLHEAAGFETLTLAGIEPAISADDESYNRLQGTQRQQWLDLLYEISTEPSTLGASRHLLYIGRRKG